MKEKLAALSGELVQLRLKQLSAQSSVCLVETLLDSVAARNLVNGMASQLTGHGAVLLPKGENEFQYIIGSQTEDVRMLAAELAKRFQGRGGGSMQMVQGTVRGEAEEIQAFLCQ